VGPNQSITTRRNGARSECQTHAVEWGLSNSRIEGINAKIRLINNRAHGHRSAEALTASIYLTLGGITIPLPTET
jgi:transposase